MCVTLTANWAYKTIGNGVLLSFCWLCFFFCFFFVAVCLLCICVPLLSTVSVDVYHFLSMAFLEINRHVHINGHDSETIEEWIRPRKQWTTRFCLHRIQCSNADGIVMPVRSVIMKFNEFVGLNVWLSVIHRFHRQIIFVWCKCDQDVISIEMACLWAYMCSIFSFTKYTPNEMKCFVWFWFGLVFVTFNFGMNLLARPILNSFTRNFL